MSIVQKHGVVSGATAPVPSPASGSFTAASATLRYTLHDDYCLFELTVTITTVNTGSGQISVPLPFMPTRSTTSSGHEAVSTGKAVWGQIDAGTASVAIKFYDNSTSWASGNVIRISGKYYI